MPMLQAPATNKKFSALFAWVKPNSFSPPGK